MSYISLACIAALGCIGLLGAAFGYIRQHRAGLPSSAYGSDPGSGIRSPGNPDGMDRAPIREPIRDPVHDPIRHPIRDPIRIPILEPIRGPMRDPISAIRSRHPNRHPIWVSRPGGIGIGLHWAALGCIGLVVAALSSGKVGLHWFALD